MEEKNKKIVVSTQLDKETYARLLMYVVNQKLKGKNVSISKLLAEWTKEKLDEAEKNE